MGSKKEPLTKEKKLPILVIPKAKIEKIIESESLITIKFSKQVEFSKERWTKERVQWLLKEIDELSNWEPDYQDTLISVIDIKRLIKKAFEGVIDG